MQSITFEQIQNCTRAQFSGASLDTRITSICTDSRNIKLGCLFIAIKGDTHDGHHHLQTAANAGAAAAMVHDECLSHLPLFRVGDTRKAMGQLATLVRSHLTGTVIAVAGSNGKTGTKNLIHSALSAAKSGTISPKSFNNDIGVPLTIFDADPSHDYLVLEVGTNHPGEILNLSKIARPDVAIITSIGAEHLEFLGDIDGVIKENSQIIAGLNPNGMLIVNGDCPELLTAVSNYPGRVVTFGFGSHNSLHAEHLICDLDGVRFLLQGKPIYIPLLGRHTAVNSLAAIAVGRYLGVSDDSIFAGLATATGPEMRLELQQAGSIKLLNDAYNANPHSMRAALETLRDIHINGRRMAILGDMRELGTTADGYHREIGQFAGECGLDALICVGEKSRLMADAAAEHGLPAEWFETSVECARHVSSLVREDDVILIKASRGMKLEIVANAIRTMVAESGIRQVVEDRMQRVVRTASITSSDTNQSRTTPEPQRIL